MLTLSAVWYFVHARTILPTMQWHSLLASRPTRYALVTTSYALGTECISSGSISGSCPQFNGFFPMSLSVILPNFVKIGLLVFEVSCKQTNNEITDRQTNGRRWFHTPRFLRGDNCTSILSGWSWKPINRMDYSVQHSCSLTYNQLRIFNDQEVFCSMDANDRLLHKFAEFIVHRNLIKKIHEITAELEPTKVP